MSLACIGRAHRVVQRSGARDRRRATGVGDLVGVVLRGLREDRLQVGNVLTASE